MFTGMIKMDRIITFAQAINEAQFQLLESDPKVLIMGLGVPSPTGVFGSTTGLQKAFGSNRVLDIPAAENGMTGIALGTAIAGMRPIMVHSRVDFSLLSMDPIVNQAAKWRYMYGGKTNASLTIRMIIGRGWGQGPQHSQSLHSWLAHIPGLRVLMPTTPSDAKGMLINAVNSLQPTIIFEHRWLFGISGHVDKHMYKVKYGSAAVRKIGNDITLIGNSYMTIECIEAAKILETMGISTEVVDLRSISPLDVQTLVKSVSKTKRMVVVDNGHIDFGISGEVVSKVIENLDVPLLCKPKRFGFPHTPTPTAYSLSELYYPRIIDIIEFVAKLFNTNVPSTALQSLNKFTDVPNHNFIGPY